MHIKGFVGLYLKEINKNVPLHSLKVKGPKVPELYIQNLIECIMPFSYGKGLPHI